MEKRPMFDWEQSSLKFMKQDNTKFLATQAESCKNMQGAIWVKQLQNLVKRMSFHVNDRSQTIGGFVKNTHQNLKKTSRSNE